MKMKHFILGILFVSVFLPLIDAFQNIIGQAAELACMEIASRTAKTQAAAREFLEEPINTNVIGFQIPNHNEEEDEYYEE